MIVIGFFLLCISLLFFLGNIIKSVKIEMQEWGFIIFFLVFGLSIIAFCIEPPEAWDLARHYELINEMEISGWSYVLNKSIYAHLPVINMIYGILAMIKMPHLLPVIVVIICYTILWYIVYKTVKGEKMDTKYVSYFVLFNFALCPYLHMVSGIRNILAYAIASFALYIDVIQKKNKILVIMMYLSTLLIHPSSSIILGIRLLLPIIERFNVIWFILPFWSLAIESIIKLLTIIPNQYIKSIGWKLLDYLTGNPYSGYKILIFKYIMLVSILVLVIYIQKTVKNINKNLSRYVNTLKITIFIAIGAFRIVFITDRMCYFIAFAGIPVLAYLCKNLSKKTKQLLKIEMLTIGGMLFIHQILYFSKDLVG